MFRLPLLVLFWLMAVLPVQAEIGADTRRLVDALGLPEIIDVMRIEGLDYADELAESMFPERAGGEWRALVSDIYDADKMADVTYAQFENTIDTAHMGALIGFFESALGQEIIALEISARVALLDSAVESSNAQHVAGLIASGEARIDLLTRFIDVNDLLESNVVGGLNSNFSFFSALVEGGAYPEPQTEDQLLRDVWSQEDDIRADTRKWLYEFLSLAYTPLSDEELLDYIALSETPAGRALNNALFAGFDNMFDGISRALGLAAARIMTGEDL